MRGGDERDGGRDGASSSETATANPTTSAASSAAETEGEELPAVVKMRLAEVRSFVCEGMA